MRPRSSALALLAVAALAGCSAQAARPQAAPQSTATVAGVPGASGPQWVCRYDHAEPGGMGLTVVVTAGIQSCYTSAESEMYAMDGQARLPLTPWRYNADTYLSGVEKCAGQGTLQTMLVTVTVTGQAAIPGALGTADEDALAVCSDLGLVAS